MLDADTAGDLLKDVCHEVISEDCKRVLRLSCMRAKANNMILVTAALQFSSP